MNKQGIIEQIAKGAKISKAAASRAFNSTFKSITQSLKKGQRVSIVGFGSFRVRARKARKGRNPQTGETIQIKARKVPVFSAGSLLKKSVR
jgi:DNA-binding protein HU-beta